MTIMIKLMRIEILDMSLITIILKANCLHKATALAAAAMRNL